MTFNTCSNSDLRAKKQPKFQPGCTNAKPFVFKFYTKYGHLTVGKMLYDSHKNPSILIYCFSNTDFILMS